MQVETWYIVHYFCYLQLYIFCYHQKILRRSYCLIENNNYLCILIYSRIIYQDWHITLQLVSKEISRFIWNVYDNDDMCLVMWFVCFSKLRIVQWNPFISNSSLCTYNYMPWIVLIISMSIFPSPRNLICKWGIG